MELNKKRELVRKSVMTTGEALEYLEFSRQRLNQIVHEGRLTPIVEGVFLRDDIINFKKDRPTPKMKAKYKKRKDMQDARKKKGLTQNDIAKLIGVSVSYYGKIERGETKPSREMLTKIADILDITKS